MLRCAKKMRVLNKMKIIKVLRILRRSNVHDATPGYINFFFLFSSQHVHTFEYYIPYIHMILCAITIVLFMYYEMNINTFKRGFTKIKNKNFPYPIFSKLTHPYVLTDVYIVLVPYVVFFFIFFFLFCNVWSVCIYVVGTYAYIGT